jgi:F0F1-type ATP synthase membrane subunit b/b'
METKEHEVAERLEAATALLERTLAWLEERRSALSGQVEKISATVEQTRREEELEQKLAQAEREIAELKAVAERGVAEERSAAEQLDAAGASKPSPLAASPVRRTVPAATTEMLAKHGIGEGPVDVKTLDAALNGLSLEQRIAVKSQLHRAGAI